MSQNKKCPATLAKPSKREQKAISTARKRVGRRTPRTSVKIRQDKNGQISFVGGGHSDHEGWFAQLQDTFGTSGQAFALSQLNQLISFCQNSEKEIDETRLDAMIAMIEACQPENELEAALAVQMALTHFTSTQVIRRAANADYVPQFNSMGNMAVKFARTFALQAEALAKLKRGGQQTVKVVHVHAGGQAVVGNVTPQIKKEPPARGGECNGKSNQPHAKGAITAQRTAQLHQVRSKDAERHTVPVACGCQ